VAFQRKKPAAIGVKAPFPGFIEPALALSIERVPSGERWVRKTCWRALRLSSMRLVNADRDSARIKSGASFARKRVGQPRLRRR
jgi:hypothetical protein